MSSRLPGLGSPAFSLLFALASCREPPAPSPPPPPPLPPAASVGTAPAAAADAQAAEAKAAHVRANYTKFEYRIPMRDGVRLFTSVYLPNDASASRRYPLLMVRTPYSVAPYGAGRYRPGLGTEGFEKEGFTFVFQDVRGRYMSEGQYVNVRPHRDEKRGPSDIDESSDTHDTITWLLAHVPFHNGRVGMWGISYPGFYASAGAIDSHPALKAVSPQAPIADWWRGDDMHRHGAFNLQMAFAFFSNFGRPRPKPIGDEDTFKRFEYDTPDAYQYYLDLGPLAAAGTSRLKGEVAFWNEIAQHPNYDEFWTARNLLPHLRHIKAAVLVVGGWFDTEDLYGPLATYRAIEAQNRGTQNSLLIGPWRHGGWARGSGDRLGDAEFGFPTGRTYQDLALAFFKHHLKGGPDPALPEAMVFETGANRWRRFDSWPPREARAAKLFFAPSGGLSFADPATDAAFDEYPSDPARPVPYTQQMTQQWSAEYMTEDQRFAARRPDVLVYQTPPLERDVTLAGPLEAELFVSTTGTDADWVVKLIDVNPGTMPGFSDDDRRAGKLDRGGQQLLVRGEPFRGRFRDGGATPKPFKPGEVTPVRFAINDVFHTFQRGHRLMIQIQSSWFPFIDRNPQTFVPNIFEAKPADFHKATHRLHRGRETPSGLRVKLLPALDESSP
jgi:putative CocE/NonD family hydrolase